MEGDAMKKDGKADVEEELKRAAQAEAPAVEVEGDGEDAAV